MVRNDDSLLLEESFARVKRSGQNIPWNIEAMDLYFLVSRYRI